MTPSYDPDWTVSHGWSVITGSLPKGSKLTFTGSGDGKPGSAVFLKRPFRRIVQLADECFHEPSTDSVFYRVGGVEFEVRRNGKLTPPRLEADKTGRLAGGTHKDNPIISGSSWTAEEGSGARWERRRPGQRRQGAVSPPAPGDSEEGERPEV